MVMAETPGETLRVAIMGRTVLPLETVEEAVAVGAPLETVVVMMVAMTVGEDRRKVDLTRKGNAEAATTLILGETLGMVRMGEILPPTLLHSLTVLLPEDETLPSRSLILFGSRPCLIRLASWLGNPKSGTRCRHLPEGRMMLPFTGLWRLKRLWPPSIV